MNVSLLTMSKSCLVVFAVCGAISGVVAADDSAAQASNKDREAVRDERPDEARGWLIVTKESYWPLCYESLDLIQESRELIGSDKHEELADTFDKCSAWLTLAASAAMTDGESGVLGAADRFSDAATSIREGTLKLDKSDLNDLATLGLLCMAKSHLMRAAEPDLNFEPERSREKSPQAGELAKIEGEIASEKVEQLRQQYRYDTVESRKHLSVAQTYLKAAAEAGGFDVDPTMAAKIPSVPGDEDLLEYVDDELRVRIGSMLTLVEGKRKELSKALAAKQ